MLQIARGPTREPIRILLHGQEGVGKTTWAAGCPGAVFLTAEDGGGDLDYARAVLPSWQELRTAVRDLIGDPQGVQTVVIDTIDSYERLLWQHICQDEGKDTIEEVGGGYGKGYTKAAEMMAALQRDLDILRSKHRINVILLAHSHVRPFNDPLGAPFDRYEVRMHKGSADLWKGWADAILFACFDVTVMKQGKKGRVVEAGAMEKGKALEGVKRVIYTSKEAAYDAKNRHNLPEEIPLSWDAFARAMKWDERAVAIKAAKTHHPSWEADRTAFCAYLGDLGDPYVLGEGRKLYDTIAKFIEEGGYTRPSQATQAWRDSYRRLLATNEVRAAFTAWDCDGAVPDLKAIAASLKNSAAAAAK